jgi:flagellar motor switch protein FliN/FliY
MQEEIQEKQSEPAKNIERLLDVEMNVTVRFGTAEVPLREIVHFGVGSTIDEPVELLVNNYPFARGEVVVIDGYYGVRVTEINSSEERSRTLFSNPPNS